MVFATYQRMRAKGTSWAGPSLLVIGYVVNGGQYCVGECVMASVLESYYNPQGDGLVETGAHIFEMGLFSPLYLLIQIYLEWDRTNPNKN